MGGSGPRFDEHSLGLATTRLRIRATGRQRWLAQLLSQVMVNPLPVVFRGPGAALIVGANGRPRPTIVMES